MSREASIFIIGGVVGAPKITRLIHRTPDTTPLTNQQPRPVSSENENEPTTKETTESRERTIM
jgi:hypothetical protein